MTDEEYTASFNDAVREEQAQLWSDLEQAVRNAHAGCWSVQCENLTDRIVSLALFVGATPWGEVGVSLLRSGVYERIFTEAAIPYEPINWDAVARTEAVIAGGLSGGSR